MFDIGFSELLLIGVIALLVLGPERLPQAARATGLWVGRLRAIVQRFTADIDRELKAEELRQTLREEARLLAEPVETLRSDVAAARDGLTGSSPAKSVIPDRTAASTNSDGT